MIEASRQQAGGRRQEDDAGTRRNGETETLQIAD